MKVLGTFAAVLILTSSAALAENDGPSGRGSVTGDPAASSATPGTAPTIGAARSNPSGSGTSTSGGRDDNGDQGRDRMIDSNRNVMPLDQLYKPDTASEQGK